MKKLFLFFLIPFAAFAQSGIPEATEAQVTARQGIGYVSARRLPAGGGSADGTVLFGSASATGGSDGDTYIETDTGTVSKKAAGSWASQVQFQLYSSVLTTYAGIDPTANVQSLLGATDYSAFKSLLTLGNVDNTSDATKNSAAATLTNKRITARIATLTDAATVAPATDDYDGGILTELSQTTDFLNPTGTPTDGQKYTLRIKSTTTRSITWTNGGSGTKYRASPDVPLPSATSGSGKTDYLVFMHNAADDKWDLVGRAFGF